MSVTPTDSTPGTADACDATPPRLYVAAGVRLVSASVLERHHGYPVVRGLAAVPATSEPLPYRDAWRVARALHTPEHPACVISR